MFLQKGGIVGLGQFGATVEGLGFSSAPLVPQNGAPRNPLYSAAIQHFMASQRTQFRVQVPQPRTGNTLASTPTNKRTGTRFVRVMFSAQFRSSRQNPLHPLMSL